jgi:hypothetical protein
MKPRTHTRILCFSPLVGIVLLFAGFGILALTEASLNAYFAVTGASLFLIVGLWALARIFLVASCPDCGAPMKLAKGKETLVYECRRCSRTIDSGHNSRLDTVP